VPPPGPGILVPDATVSVGTRDRPVRFRELARDGLLLLTTGGTYLDEATDLDRATESSRRATEVPTRTLSLSGIDVTGALSAALDARPGEVWVIRPDAHIAAVLRKPGPHEVITALLRALGRGAAPETLKADT
jgi:pentachlorophenol monooxygenase/3-(3-hydroxy-phenyl)propionate hydroxylase